MFVWLTRLIDNPLLTFYQTVLFMILNVLDGHSTYLVLFPDHYSREKNPIARWFFRKIGIPDGIIIFKTVLLFGLILCICYYAAWDAFTINIILILANLLFILVVIHNYRVYRRMALTMDQDKIFHVYSYHK